MCKNNDWKFQHFKILDIKFPFSCGCVTVIQSMLDNYPRFSVICTFDLYFTAYIIPCFASVEIGRHVSVYKTKKKVEHVKGKDNLSFLIFQKSEKRFRWTCSCSYHRVKMGFNSYNSMIAIRPSTFHTYMCTSFNTLSL